jgi:hypothetical protein
MDFFEWIHRNDQTHQLNNPAPVVFPVDLPHILRPGYLRRSWLQKYIGVEWLQFVPFV